jgi:hypothetical protein
MLRVSNCLRYNEINLYVLVFNDTMRLHFVRKDANLVWCFAVLYNIVDYKVNVGMVERAAVGSNEK